MYAQAVFIFHDSLNDFLPLVRKGAAISYSFEGKPAVKDAIEALGIPHPEIDRILVNGSPVNFQYALKPGDVVKVFPVSVGTQEGDAFLLRPPLPEPVKFVLDVHLGKLARVLRMLGFDTVYQNDYADKIIAELARQQSRVVLTRDRGLLKHKIILWGYWLRSQYLEEQLQEVVRYFKLENRFAPFTRCLECNGLIREVPKESVLDLLPPKTRMFFNEFYQCQRCRKVYWKGSHYERMQVFIGNLSRSRPE